jgi:hypothetical protein
VSTLPFTAKDPQRRTGMDTNNMTIRKPETVDREIFPAQHESLVLEETREPTVVDRTMASVESKAQMPMEVQIRALAHEIYRRRCDMGHDGDELGDWIAAESRLTLRCEDLTGTNVAPTRASQTKTARVRSDSQVPPA